MSAPGVLVGAAEPPPVGGTLEPPREPAADGSVDELALVPQAARPTTMMAASPPMRAIRPTLSRKVLIIFISCPLLSSLSGQYISVMCIQCGLPTFMVSP